MPPKVKVTKEDIVNVSLELVRKNGVDAINARAIASALNCSTQPLFSNFESMEELHATVGSAAYDLYLDFIRVEVESEKYPQYKAFGMAYIRFAREEKELFKFLFMRDRTDDDTSPDSDFEQSVQIIMENTGLSHEKAMLMHLEMWIAVHGIATMHATSFLTLDWELISNVISDIYQGIRTRHLEEIE